MAVHSYHLFQPNIYQKKQVFCVTVPLGNWTFEKVVQFLISKNYLKFLT